MSPAHPDLRPVATEATLTLWPLHRIGTEAAVANLGHRGPWIFAASPAVPVPDSLRTSSAHGTEINHRFLHIRQMLVRVMKEEREKDAVPIRWMR